MGGDTYFQNNPDMTFVFPHSHHYLYIKYLISNTEADVLL